MANIPDKFIDEIPKTDLHVHLDGSLRINTLLELSKEMGLELPSETTEGLKETVFKERYMDLNDYLEGFKYTCAVLQTREALERAATELAEDNIAEGVYYLEVRFAPQLHVHNDLTIPEILRAVCKGLERAKIRFNRQKEVKEKKRPQFHYGIIVCAMRYFNEYFSPYYKKILEVHHYSPLKKTYGLSSMELCLAAVKVRDEEGLPIVGFDLAGREDGYPADDHIEAFHYAHKNFIKKTVHAGEAYGPESIFQAITDLYADRIGHCYHLFSPHFITNPNINRQQYIQHLAEYIADRRITIEICLTSNMQTNPYLRYLDDHTLRKMLDYRMSVTICTDNRLISNTTVSNELKIAISNFDLSPKMLRNIVMYGFKRSFFPGNYKEKREYVHNILNYYEELEEKHGVFSTVKS